MKILMMQEEMKELKNRLFDKDEELKHTKAWNESLIKESEDNISKIKGAEVSGTELLKIKEERDTLIQRVSSLEQSIVSKASIIGNLLNAACDIGGRSLLHRLSADMQNGEIWLYFDSLFFIIKISVMDSSYNPSAEQFMLLDSCINQSRTSLFYTEEEHP